MIIIDRIENGIAACEVDGVIKEIPLSGISGSAREGDVLTDSGDGSFLIVDVDATKQRRTAIAERFERLKARKNTRL